MSAPIRATQFPSDLAVAPWRPGVPVGALLGWVLLQLAALGLMSADLKLWAGSRGLSALALMAMLWAQLFAIALFLPLLAGSGRRAIMTVLAGLPFLCLAGLLADQPGSAWLLPALALAAWTLFLSAAWRCTHTLPAGRLLLHMTAFVVPSAGALLFFLNIEWNSAADLRDHVVAGGNPTVPHKAAYWSAVAALSIAAAAGWLIPVNERRDAA